MSTPTGSKAYSMKAGGSMVHPSVPDILFIPIFPHRFWFRPIVFPDYAELRLKIDEYSRLNAWTSFDRKFRQQLKRGDGMIGVQLRHSIPPAVSTSDLSCTVPTRPPHLCLIIHRLPHAVSTSALSCGLPTAISTSALPWTVSHLPSLIILIRYSLAPAVC